VLDRPRTTLLSLVLVAAPLAACSSSGGDSIAAAQAAFDRGDYAAAKTLLNSASGTSLKYDLLNKVDQRIQDVEALNGDLANAKANAAREGKVKTLDRLDLLKRRAPDSKTRAAVEAAIADIDKLCPPVDPKKDEYLKKIPTPPRIGTENVTPPKRTVDEKAPSDGLKEKKEGGRSAQIPARWKELTDTARDDARAGRFRQALELLAMATSEGGEESEGLGDVAEEVRAASQAALTELSQRTRLILDPAGSYSPSEREEQSAKLREELARFPANADSEALREQLDRALRASAVATKSDTHKNQPAGGAGAAVASPVAGADPKLEEGLRLARLEIAEGKFTDAKIHFLEAAGKALTPVGKSYAAGLAEDTSRLAGAIAKLAEAFARDSRAAADIDGGREGRGKPVSLGEAGVEIETASGRKLLPWNRVPASAIAQFIARIGSWTATERLGLALLLEHADARTEADGMLKIAADGDASLQPVIDGILARRSGMEVPSYGFVWERGRWMTFRERESLKLADRIQALLAKLETASSARERAALSDELTKLGSEAGDALVIALKGRRQELVAKLRSAGMSKRLEPLRAERARLDASRKFALELIFDEVKYFYPFKPPECPPEKAKLYPAVQQEVDHRVRAVKDVWDSKLAIGLGTSASALAQLHEVEEQLGSLGVHDVPMDADIVQLLCVDPKAPEITVRNYCDDLSEKRKLFDRNRNIDLYNASVETTATHEERKQIEITNAYREMLGRRRLALNEKVILAARKHSKWMADSGVFSHFSTLPGLRTPFERMKAEGYERGVSENIAMGTGPEGAHAGWTHSAGHHRNILMAGHSEIGVGNIGSLWTQNYGVGDEFRRSSVWRD